MQVVGSGSRVLFVSLCGEEVRQQLIICSKLNAKLFESSRNHVDLHPHDANGVDLRFGETISGVGGELHGMLSIKDHNQNMYTCT
jgi:hypothetical protein